MALVLSAAAGLLDPWLLPQPLLVYEHSQRGVRSKPAELLVMFLPIPGVIAGLVSVAGLYRFRPVARWLGVGAWAYMLVWTCFSPGPVLTNAVATSLSHCSTLLAGVVLAVAFFSPVAEWFQKEPAT